MTEDDAKTKWCPFARVVVGEIKTGGYQQPLGLPSHNRVALGQATVSPPAALCIGSACMAWRWDAVECEPPFGSGGISTAELLRLRPDLTPYHNPADTKRLFAVPSGRCGLAEKPA